MADLSNTIDMLGSIKAQMAGLKEQENELKAILIAAGVGAHEGNTFRATVSVYNRDTLDMEAVREKLSAQFIRAHTVTTEVTKVNVVARKGLLAKAA